MTNNRNLDTIIWGALLVILFTVSVVLFLNYSRGKQRYVFFFPSETERGHVGEVRYLPVSEEQEGSVMIFLKELVLGPDNIRSLYLLPKATAVNSVILRDGVLYADFSGEVIFKHKEVPLELEDILFEIKRNITFNFKDIDVVNITIEGQIPSYGRNVAISADEAEK